MRKCAVICLTVFMLLGCGSTTQPLETLTKPSFRGSQYHSGSVLITRIHDDDKGVTCYVAQIYSAGGISCVADSQLLK